jgi:type VI secretion system secreted protein VgrG
VILLCSPFPKNGATLTFSFGIPYPLHRTFKIKEEQLSQDTETRATLTIGDTPLALHVIRFSGSEALNRPYRFEIDFISPSVMLDAGVLTSRSAYLSFGDAHHGVHGLIGNALVLYVGKGISHVRVTLEPRLQSLQQRYHRRLHQQSSVPQILQRLLEENGIGTDHYRLGLTVGTYPPRQTCAQYDESDLHLLQRLCAEEGIHFRFEHSRDRHLLIFADDPADFRELSTPTRYQKELDHTTLAPSISYLAEHFSVRTMRSGHDRPPRQVDDQEATTENPRRMPVHGFAANQSRGALLRAQLPNAAEARRRQLSERTLERMRCERRHVYGLSDQPSLVSGQTLSVLAHPNTLFNDQWLLTDVHHVGKQPQVLSELDPADIEGIIKSASLETDQRPQFPFAGPVSSVEVAPFTKGYRNCFRVIPWTLPYRPPLTQQKPQIHGPQTATLIGAYGHAVKRDPQGRIQAKLHWPVSPTNDEAVLWLRLAVATPSNEAPCEVLAGSEVLLSHFDNDPDQPIICGLVKSATAQFLRPRIQIDGRALSSIAAHIHLSAGQTLDVEASDSVTLTSQHARLELHTGSLRMTALKNLAGRSCRETEIRYGRAPSRSSTPEQLTTATDFSALLQPLGRPQPDPNA